MENTDKPHYAEALALARACMNTISRVLNGSQDDASLAASPEPYSASDSSPQR